MISIIVAIARNGVIGNGNALIWRIAEDLRRFKALTTGHPVIMGRKTYESIGRPLPNRTNVVVTRRKDYRPEGASSRDRSNRLSACSTRPRKSSSSEERKSTRRRCRWPTAST